VEVGDSLDRPVFPEPLELSVILKSSRELGTVVQFNLDTIFLIANTELLSKVFLE
jgi:hypothetical protein